jgi:CTP synthase
VRGTEGKIAAIKWARENKIPFLGICLGFQMAVVEYSRSVLGLKDASSEEIDPQSTNQVIVNMPEISTTQLGGTMRLGSRLSFFAPGSESTTTGKLYSGVGSVDERHRHRYEVNPKYVEEIERNQEMMFIGKDEKHERMSILELKSIYS